MMVKYFKTNNQVVGVEMVQEAVRDAIKNAEENKVYANSSKLEIL